MSKWRARVDSNQADVVKALRAQGWVVQHLHSVGGGCPDLLIGAAGFNLLQEVKGAKGRLTKDQVPWHEGWTGQVDVVRSPEEAVEKAWLRLESYFSPGPVPGRRPSGLPSEPLGPPIDLSSQRRSPAGPGGPGSTHPEDSQSSRRAA